MSIDNTGTTGTTGTTGSLLHTLTYPNLGDSGYGQGLNDLVNNINENFQKIVSSEFLRGPEGKSINLIERLITDDPDNNGYTYAVEIFNAIIDDLDEDSYAGLSAASVIGDKYDSDGNQIIPRISLIYETVGSEVNLISSLPFVFIDPRFTDLDNQNINFADIEDCSCIVQYMDGSFKKVQTFPTLYYDVNVEQFCWKLNGVNTGLIARGPKGDPGNNGHIYVMKVDGTVNTGVQNKYKVIPFIAEETNIIENINNGDFAFVAKMVTSGEMENYEYYIGLLKVEDGEVYAIINDNSIYNQFTGINFNDYLKHINIYQNIYPKGLFIPINSDATSAHIFCANALTNINNNNNDDRLNMSILPVSSLDAVNGSSIAVRRKIKLEVTSIPNVTNEEIVGEKEVEFNTRITSKSSLKSMFPNEAADILRIVTGEYKGDINDYNEKIDVYYFNNNSNNFHIFSDALNIYGVECLCAIDSSTQNKFISGKDFLITFKCNHTYLEDNTNVNNKVENASLNFGYESINVGLDDINIGPNEVKERLSNFNVKGNIIASANITTDTLTSNTARLNKITNQNNELVDIENSRLINAELIGSTTANSLNVGERLDITGGGLVGDTITIDADTINITSKTYEDTDALNIDIPSYFSRNVNISTGANNVVITNKKIYRTGASGEYTWTGATSTVNNKTYELRAAKKTGSNNNIDLSGSATRRTYWSEGASTSKDYDFTFNLDTTDVYKSAIKFKPLLIGFTYNARNRGGVSCCPIFSYGLRNFTMEIWTYDGSKETKHTIFSNRSLTYGKQLRYESGLMAGDKVFAREGSTYTDYVTVTIPAYSSANNTSISKVRIAFSLYISGDNDGSYDTVGNVWFSGITNGLDYNTVTGSDPSASRSKSSSSEGQSFMHVTLHKTTGTYKTVICADGIMMGQSKDKYGYIRWNGNSIELKNVIDID